MKRRSAIAMLLALGLSALAYSPQASSGVAGWVSLFDGVKSLDGFNKVGGRQLADRRRHDRVGQGQRLPGHQDRLQGL